MQLILFRHGPAGRADSDAWPDDSKRPLTARGKDRTRRAAGGIARLAGTVRWIATSPYARCAGTAEIAAEVLGCKTVKTLPELEPGATLRAVLRALPAYGDDDTVLIVGHEPDLGQLAGALVLGAPSALPLKKAGACALRFTGVVASGRGRLVWHLPPRILRRLARHRAGV